MDQRTYFQAIEEHFIRLRGAPLLLSPTDWQVAQRWWKEGIPIDLVTGTLDELFGSRAERGLESPVQSLRYCARAVDGAWQRAGELEQADRRQTVAPLDVQGRLAALAAAIPETLPGAAEVRAGVLALAGDARWVEDELVQLDRGLIARAEDAVDEATRDSMSARVDARLTTLAGRMGRADLDAARARLLEQALRRELGLPVLSLFAG